MARRIGHPVAVQVREDGAPIAFTWRGVTYRVCGVSARWLTSRGSEPAKPSHAVKRHDH